MESESRIQALEAEVRRLARVQMRGTQSRERLRALAVRATFAMVVCLPALATAVEPPNIFSAGEVISAEDMNQNFDVLAQAVTELELAPDSETYGALVAGTVVEHETAPWIDSVSGGAGTYQVTFSPTAFTSQPVCTATPVSDGVDGVMTMISQLNTGGTTVQVRRDGSIAQAANFYLVCLAG